MASNLKAQTEQDLQGWPEHWPPPCKFLGPLIFNITALHFQSSLTEHQVFIRFKNQYGVRISENIFHEGLFLVAILRFYGPHDRDCDLVRHFPVPDVTWYCTGLEAISLSEKVSQWQRPSGKAGTGPAA